MAPRTRGDRPKSAARWAFAHGYGPYVLLFSLIYSGWGVLSPFLPTVMAHQGATAEDIGLLLAVAMLVRLLSIPMLGLVADRFAAPRRVLGCLLLAAAVLALAYGQASGLAALLLVSAVHAIAIGPIGPLPDALAVSAAGEPGRERFSYAWVRGAGAAGFIAGSLLAGWAVASAGSAQIVLWLNAALFALAGWAVSLLPRPQPSVARRDDDPSAHPITSAGRLRALLQVPSFRWLLLAAGLIAGSHALYAGFATLHWQAAGLTPTTIGWLWAIAVMAEVVIFFLLGPPLLARLGPAELTVLAAGAGILRWSIMAVTAWLPAMLFAQPLHGLTFAAQHLAAMAVIARVAPVHLTATAQTLYASLGTGLVTAALTLTSGYLYGWWGAQGFWLMALLCAAAVPAAFMMRPISAHRPPSRSGSRQA